MSTKLVDFHCHLDLFPDPVAAIEAAEAAGVYSLTMTTTPRAWPRNRDMTAPSRFIRAALGLHPQLVAERANELSMWELFLPEAKYIGEVGLDASPRYYKSMDLQKRVFSRILIACAESGGKIISVHSVRAVSAVLDQIESHLPSDRGKVVLHWFTGSKSEARRAVALGCYFSINAQMLAGERGRELVASLPSNRLLTETDAPFTKVDGRPSVPADVALVVASTARARREATEVVRSVVYSNLRSLLTTANA